MLINYFLADGQEIKYETKFDWVTMEDVDQLALKYAELRPNDLPESVFINIRLLSEFSKMMGVGHFIGPYTPGPMIVSFMTSVGPLKVIPKPYACDQCLLLVGKDEDFDRYDLDKVFEEVVLKDCERE
jgi:hypothetical protein